jgi:stage III sporulation protein AF
MIGAVRSWLTAIVAVTLLLSVLQTLLPAGAIRQIASFTGGLLLLVVLLRPLLGAELEDLQLDLSDYAQAIQERQAELTQAGETALEERIAEQTAAYISDKAPNVTVRVTTEPDADGVPIPVEAELWGPWSEELAAYMEEELGIVRERQVWHDV